MKCDGNCYCGNYCVVDHEKVAEECNCNDNHFICKKKCERCNKYNCVYIANHKTNYGGCRCLVCEFS